MLAHFTSGICRMDQATRCGLFCLSAGQKRGVRCQQRSFCWCVDDLSRGEDSQILFVPIIGLPSRQRQPSWENILSDQQAHGMEASLSV